MRALLAEVSTLSPDQRVLTYIQTRDHAALRELLQQEPHLSRVENYYSETPMHWAAYYGTVETVELIMVAGGEINRRDSQGYTPLHKAISAKMRHDMLDSGRVAEAEIEAIIRYLIEAGAVANTQKLTEDTPLNDAITWRIKPELIAMLLEAGADPNIPDEGGDTALHKAAATGDIAVVKLLLDAQADINALTVWRYTPLTIAIFNEAEEVVALLLEAGADPTIADADGNKPWHHAKKKGNQTIINLLR